MPQVMTQLCGPGFAQQVKLVSGTGDDNSDVTYTIIGTDAKRR